MTAERTTNAKRRAVERGVPPFPNVPPGYRQRKDGQLEPHPKQARAVADAFKMRAKGATVMEVREHLRRRGIVRSYHGTTALLGSRIVLGELRFGDLVNPSSHPAIVDVGVWEQVQRMRLPRGRRPKSERLLARLGVLRCATCGSRLVVGSTDQNGKRHHMYRCPPVGDCPRRVTVSAELAEQVVAEAVQKKLSGVRGSASVTKGIAKAERDVERREQELDAAVEAFTGLEDVAAAREKLHAFRTARDAARERLAELQAAAAPTVIVSAGGDWDAMTLDERRALIRASILRVDVAPGRGRERFTVQTFGK